MTLKRNVLRMCAALVAAMTIGAIASSTAGAVSWYNYCGWQVAANSACSDSRSGYLIANTASYPGSGDVGVCERVVAAESGSQLSRRCDNRIVGSGTDLNGYGLIWKTATVGNDSNYKHTIDGTAYIP